MSDEAGAAVAPPVEAQPIATESVESTTTPSETNEVSEPILETGGGKSAARRNSLKRAQTRQEQYARTKEAEAQPRQDAGTPEGGQFKGEEVESEPAPEVVPEGPTDLDAPQEAAPIDSPVESTEPDTPSDEYVDIPLPDGHPLRDRGKTSIRAHKDDEREMRSIINTPRRARDAEAERDRAVEALALANARAAALSGDTVNYAADPAYVLALQQIRDAEGFGGEMADKFEAGLKAERELAAIRAESDASLGAQIQRTVDQFADTAYERSAEVFKVWQDAGELSNRVPPLMRQYVDAVDNRNTRSGTNTQPTTAEFFHWARSAYGADPRVAQLVTQERTNMETREKARIRQEVEAEYKAKQAKDDAEAADRHSVRPPIGNTRSQSTTPVTDPAVEETVPGNSRKSARARARERGRSHAPQQ